MISIWHLLWIIPLVNFISFITFALVTANKIENEGEN